MPVRSEALSLFFWSMTPCGVGSGTLSFGDGVMEGAMGGGCRTWGELIKLFLGGLFVGLFSYFFSFPASPFFLFCFFNVGLETW